MAALPTDRQPGGFVPFPDGSNRPSCIAGDSLYFLRMEDMVRLDQILLSTDGILPAGRTASKEMTGEGVSQGRKKSLSD